MQLSLSIEHERIYFKNNEYGFLGYTTYEEDFWNWISTVSWTVDTQKFLRKEKTYIKTSNKAFKEHSTLHQSVMVHWYGLKDFMETKSKDFIVEHHNNNAFDCTLENLSFAHNDLNLAKAHTYDKNQPKLRMQVGINFFKDFTSQQYQITMIFTDTFYLKINEQYKVIDSLYLLYDNNFRVVYSDANRIVDELLENRKIDFRLLSYKKFLYKEAIFYYPENGEQVSGINFLQDENGKSVLVIGKDAKGKIFFNSTPPNKDLYKN